MKIKLNYFNSIWFLIMDAIGEALSKTISNIYEVQVLQVFIETVIAVLGIYMIYKFVKYILSCKYMRKRSRSISDLGDVEILNTV